MLENNQFYYGVVESRNDPLKLGRVRVRVVGIHTEDNSLLPTYDLPWAIPLQPITSAAMSGIGSSPTGPVEGTWVMVVFRDEGSFQEPIVMGTLAGIPENGNSNEFVRQGYKVDGDGRPITDTSGNYVPASSSTESGRELGWVSEEFETGSKGPGTINDYNGKSSGDFGGASYGKWQLASYLPSNAKRSKVGRPSPLEKFVSGSSFSAEFKGLIPGTQSFDNKWREVAAKNRSAFEEEQRQYIEAEYYNKGINSLRSRGIDVSGRGEAVQNMVWSTSVQYGPSKCASIFSRAGVNSGMTDREIIIAVQDNKKRNVQTDFRSSPSLWGSLSNRCENEKAKLLSITPEDQAQEEQEANEPDQVLQQANIPEESQKTSGLGFKDPNGRYPRKNWVGEPDVSRLARNEKTEQTILVTKKRSLVKGIQSTNGVSWSEPESMYGAEYPLNHVHQTESGHVIELDDTPNKERVHIYHRAGSFVEMHPNGDVVIKSANNEYQVVIMDNNMYVGGSLNITALSDANIFAARMMNLESGGDLNITAGANLKIGAKGKAFLESDGEMFVGSSSNLNLAGSRIDLNGSWSSGGVQTTDFSIEKFRVEVYDDDGEDVEDEGKAKREIARDNPNVDLEATPEEAKDEEVEQAEPDVNDFVCGEIKAEAITPNMQISTNFTLADVSTSTALTKHSVKEQSGLTVEEIVCNLSAVASNVLEPLLGKYGRTFTITSGFRNFTGKNRSGNTSQHCLGQAVDIQFPGLARNAYVHRAQEISQLLPGFDQLILEYSGNNPVIHISFADLNRGQKRTTPDLSRYFSGFLDPNLNRIYS